MLFVYWKLTFAVTPSAQTFAAIAPQGPKSRLVAKTGRDVRSTSLRIGLGTSGGPDASKVWNRNKRMVLGSIVMNATETRDPAVPAPAPKQFTDEELKQQYGIHLATRLQTDEGGKESKWADIDDDVDDWAPETVEWMDGTKSTITASESQVALLGALAAQALKVSDEAAEEAAAAAQRLSSISSLGKTILRPGARVMSQTKPGLVLRSVPENPLASDKSATPAASKSPWAQLPPVDKVSPISFLPPAAPPLQLSSALPRETPPPDAGASVQSPTREIAADDFNRSWRDGERSSRELFNSQSGRYEPVKAQPRKPSRQESGLRAPALLQRPSQQGQGQGQGGQAEPSPSYQGNRGTSEQDGKSWTRSRRDSSSTGDRRGSQSASGRVSEEQGGGDIPEITRTESPAFPAISAIPATNAQSQSESLNPPNSTLAKPSTSVTTPQSYHARGADRTQLPPTEGVSSQDSRAAQQQLMKEKIELNRKRKKEEEALEEAAKSERIRLRLQAFNPPVSDSKAVATEEKTVSQGSELEQATLKSKDQSTNLPAKLANQEIIPSPIVAESTTTSQATVTATNSNKAGSTTLPDKVQAPKVNKTSPPTPEPTVSTRPQLAPAKSPTFVGSRPSKSLSDTNVSEATQHEVQQLPGLGQAPPLDRTMPSWGAMTQTADSSMSWTANARPLNSSNVWGPISNNRPLGNGAFEGEFQRIPPLQRQHQAGLPHHAPNSATPRPTSLSPSIPFDNGPNMPGQTYSKSGANQTSKPQAPLPPSASTSSFSQRRAQATSAMAVDSQRSSDQGLKRGWKNFHILAAEQEAEAWAKHRAEGPKEINPTFVETFIETTEGGKAGHRQVNIVKTVLNNPQDVKPDDVEVSAVDPSVAATQPTPPQVTAPPPISNGRASRFFGPGVDRVNVVAATPAPVVEFIRTGTASPPPPDSEDHPAFGRTSHPLVHLPTPAPKVKLPPMSSPSAAPLRPASPQEPVIMPTRYRIGPQPIVNSAAWQDRFNGLFGRVQPRTSANISPNSPPAQPAQSPVQQVFAVEISSKAAFDVGSVPLPTAEASTTVSLPQGIEAVKDTPSPAPSASLPDHYIESKPTEDELMDEREFGSSPTVKLPHSSYDMAILQTIPIPKYASKWFQAEMNGEFVATMPTLSFDDLDARLKVENGIRVIIRIEGREFEAKIMHEKPPLNGASRTSKMLQNKKRNTTRKPASGGSVNSQSPQSITPRSETTLTEKLSTQQDPDRRGGWAKVAKPTRGPVPSPTYNNANHDQISTSASSTTNTSQLPSNDARVAAQRQSSRGGWAKPPKGKTSSGFNPNRI